MLGALMDVLGVSGGFLGVFGLLNDGGLRCCGFRGGFGGSFW